MSAHLDLDALADLLAGEGEDASVEHLSGCPACSAALVDLEDAQEQVRTTLAALPAPQVPADLAARLDAALLQARPPEPAPRPAEATGTARALDRDDEQDDDDRDPPRAAVPAASSVVPLPRRPAPSPWPLRAVAAACAVLVLGGGAFAVTRGGSSGDASTAAGRAESPTSDEEAASGLAAAPAPPAATSDTGRDYGEGRAALEQALPQLLRGTTRLSKRSASAEDLRLATGAAALDRLRDPGELAGCLSALSGPALSGAGPSRAPLALDYAAYDGRPALVVVLPASDTPRRLDVFVVGAGCRAGDPQQLAFSRLPRP